MTAALPQHFTDWFARRGWRAHPHQLEMLAAAKAGKSALLIAPTGGGKTLAGFLPSLVELAEAEHAGTPHKGLHTLYISPLKALTADIARNLQAPVEEMGLEITVDTRTGDTKQAARKRQRVKPPNMLLTTPESLALMLSYPDSVAQFANLKTIVIDELHTLVESKRGHLLALGLARLKRLAPGLRLVGLSATVADPAWLQRWLDPDAILVHGGRGPVPDVSVLLPEGAELPWAGHMALGSMQAVYRAIGEARTAIVFVNTRAQAEMTFQELWRLNEDGLAIALHHGSLEREQRQRVEAAMAEGRLQAVVATSSLDLGIDWGAVDLVIQIGAPKGVSRLLQRIGRSNHQFDKPSRALLVPGSRFVLLECQAAIDGVHEHTLDGLPPQPGGLDVLAQHVLCVACGHPFDPDELYEEITAVLPYAHVTRETFDQVIAFVAHGGYALRAYERFHKITKDEDGRYVVASPQIARSYRMNVGTIVQEATLKVKLKRGRRLGEVEEYFAQLMEPGDTFIFAGELLRFEGIRELTVEVSRAIGPHKAPKIPSFLGGRFSFTTHLADRVRDMLHDDEKLKQFPEDVQAWAQAQKERSQLPPREGLLVETFPRGERFYLVAYCFEGRNAHQTLGMLLTKRMERFGYQPMGFVASEYVIAVWSLKPVERIDDLFDQDMLGDDLEAWMEESSLLKRTFRNCAMIAGLIDKNRPGEERSARNITFNTDTIYNALRQHEPDHILLRATREEAATGLTDVGRLGDFLARVQRQIIHRPLDQPSPLSVPVLLEIGKESVAQDAVDALLEEGSDALIEAAMG